MIICAAVKFYIPATKQNVVIPCWRHHCAYEIIRDLGFKPHEGYEEVEDGFINHKNEFLNRQEAYHHAIECGQLSATVRDTINNETLFSEDLY